MKVKMSRKELLDLILHKLEQIQYTQRELERHLTAVDEATTDNDLYLTQLDDLIKDLHLKELPGD